MEAYTCNKGAISSLNLESPPTPMTTMEWIQTQKADPAIGQEITRLKDEEVGTVKVSEDMSKEVKPYIRQKGQLCLKDGVLY